MRFLYKPYAVKKKYTIVAIMGNQYTFIDTYKIKSKKNATHSEQHFFIQRKYYYRFILARNSALSLVPRIRFISSFMASSAFISAR